MGAAGAGAGAVSDAGWLGGELVKGAAAVLSPTTVWASADSWPSWVADMASILSDLPLSEVSSCVWSSVIDWVAASMAGLSEGVKATTGGDSVAGVGSDKVGSFAFVAMLMDADTSDVSGDINCAEEAAAAVLDWLSTVLDGLGLFKRGSSFDTRLEISSIEPMLPARESSEHSSPQTTIVSENSVASGLEAMAEERPVRRVAEMDHRAV